MDAYVGISGLELAFEDYLHGIDGQLKRTVDAEGNVISEYYTKLPQAGNNVETTLDLNLQIAAEDALAYYIENLKLTASTGEGSSEGHDAEGGAVVVLDVENFEVLACASYPTYDLSRYRESAYNAELMSNPLSPVYNRALQATYPPGSTYKMCTSVAAMENGLISRYTTLTTKGIYTKYDGAWGPTCLVYSRRGANHGTIDVAQALSVSCNYFFYMVGDMLETAQLDATAKAFGLGEHTGVELVENIGRRANAETKAEIYSNMEAHWYPGDKILAAIGQSENRFTPMQMASYIATVANGGTRYAATFLKRVVAADYSTLVEENTPEVLSVVEMAPDTHAALVDGMKLVTTTGTASGYFTGYPITVAGKTGTAEHGSGGSNHGAFACFAPADDPQIAIFIYVEKSGTGGYLANVAKAIMDVYFSKGTASEMVTHENRIG
jgi:penicillin-binding protein 2